ncbi:MAG: putative Se/S carrier-like protein [Christensenellales bacterium]|jgi:hypothetical protein
MYIIAVFKSRKETLDFKCRLDCKRIGSTIINTPRQLSSGCGVSVKFEVRGFTFARYIVDGNYRTFSGFFRYNDNGRLVPACL